MGLIWENIRIAYYAVGKRAVWLRCKIGSIDSEGEFIVAVKRLAHSAIRSKFLPKISVKIEVVYVAMLEIEITCFPTVLYTQTFFFLKKRKKIYQNA